MSWNCFSDYWHRHPGTGTISSCNYNFILNKLINRKLTCNIFDNGFTFWLISCAKRANICWIHLLKADDLLGNYLSVCLETKWAIWTCPLQALGNCSSVRANNVEMATGLESCRTWHKCCIYGGRFITTLAESWQKAYETVTGGVLLRFNLACKWAALL